MQKILLTTLSLMFCLLATAALADDLSGEQLEQILDRRGDRIDHRLDQKGDRIDDRLDRRGAYEGATIEGDAAVCCIC